MKLKLYLVLAALVLATACSGLTSEQQANLEDFGSANAAVTTETLEAFISNSHQDTAGNYALTITQPINTAITLTEGVKVSLRGDGTVTATPP